MDSLFYYSRHSEDAGIAAGPRPTAPTGPRWVSQNSRDVDALRSEILRFQCNASRTDLVYEQVALRLARR